MDALKATQDGLNQILRLQQMKQKKISSIRVQRYKKHGVYQIAVTDEDRKQMIAKEHRDCDKECSRIYEGINLEREKAGLPALTNPYKK